LLPSICIPRSVEVLGRCCFAFSKLAAITFEGGSRLVRIGKSCFAHCLLPSIYIPRSVEVLGSSCFRSSKLLAITFEHESRLARIGQGCFRGCLLRSVVLPPSLTCVGPNAFEMDVAVKRLERSCVCPTEQTRPPRQSDPGRLVRPLETPRRSRPAPQAGRPQQQSCRGDAAKYRPRPCRALTERGRGGEPLLAPLRPRDRRDFT
jgi:hypothetical protein